MPAEEDNLPSNEAGTHETTINDPVPADEPLKAKSAETSSEHAGLRGFLIKARDGVKIGWLSVRQWCGALCLPIIIITFFATQKNSTYTQDQHNLLCVVCLVATMWLSELFPIPLTAMCVGPFVVLFKLAPVDMALATYMHMIPFLIWGTFFLTVAMARHSLDRRFTAWMTGLSCINGVPWRMRASMMLAAVILALFLNGPAVTALLMPVLLRQFDATPGVPLKDPEQERALSGSVLATLYAALAGGMGTLVSPPVIICVAALGGKGITIGFGEWMGIGIPAAFLVTLGAFVVLHFAIRPGKPTEKSLEEIYGGDSTPADSIRLKRSDVSGPWTWGEKVVCFSFCFTTVLWFFPALYDAGKGEYHLEILDTLPIGTVVILGTLIMFLIPDEGGKVAVMPWSVALRGCDWGVPMIVGGGITLGEYLGATGLAERIAEDFVNWTGIEDIWSLTAITIILTIALTELLSNLASVAMLTPIIYEIGIRLDPDPNVAMTPCIAVPFAAVCSFMTPWASPLNAIAYGTGHLTFTQMIKFGFLMNLVAGVIIFIVCRIFVPAIWPPSQT